MAAMMETHGGESNRFRALPLPMADGHETIGPAMAGMSEMLKTSVVTGFLGSGKTTLLRRALRAPALADTAVVVNEIGEVAIDHHLVNFVDGDVIELPGGCLCCAMREDLARTLRDLLDRRASGGVRPFRRIVIETTGLADPAPILYTLGADPMLDAELHPARVVTLVDATTGAATLDRFAEAGRQAALADVLVVSKTDLAPFGPGLARRLDTLNPDAERILGAAADPGAVLFGALRHAHPDPPPLAGEGEEYRRRPTPSPPRAAAPSSPAPASGTRLSSPSPAGGGGSGRGLATGPHAAHTHGIDAVAIALGGPISRLDFARALGALARARGNDLLRVKGILEFSDRPGRPAVVQGAQHAIFAPEWLDAWPDSDRRCRLVLVVHAIPRDEILAHFAFARPAVLGPRASRPLAAGTAAPGDTGGA
jgi:G3E family GTPase